MFRKRLEEKVVLVKEGDKVLHHPLLEYVDLVDSSDNRFAPSIMSTCSWIDYAEDPVSRNTPALDEYATSPPCRQMTFTGYHHKVVIECRNGVKVKEFLKRVSESWESAPEDDIQEELLEQLEEGIGQDEEIQEKLEEGLDFFDIAATSGNERIELYLSLALGQPLTNSMTIPPYTRIEYTKPTKVIANDHVKIEPEWGPDSTVKG
ncbi:uncharacterized protein JCM6883_004502 [Sporobolomyces salmoneus]|uniref:uncharacterized protein n=1 Tax=Sporobolomyces salmoneus TaxID=183962 RepID=UPI0031764574